MSRSGKEYCSFENPIDWTGDHSIRILSIRPNVSSEMFHEGHGESEVRFCPKGQVQSKFFLAGTKTPDITF